VESGATESTVMRQVLSVRREQTKHFDAIVGLVARASLVFSEVVDDFFRG
jgi:hypothetical protein